MDYDVVMSAEEFFGGPKTGPVPVRTGKVRGKRSKKDFFTELKVKMVMRIYGVSKQRALKIIADSAVEMAEGVPQAADGETDLSAADSFDESHVQI